MPVETDVHNAFDIDISSYPPGRRKRDSNRLLRSVSDGDINNRTNADNTSSVFTGLNHMEESIRRDTFAIISKLIPWYVLEMETSSSAAATVASMPPENRPRNFDRKLTAADSSTGMLIRSRSDSSVFNSSVNDVDTEELSNDLDVIYFRLWKEFSLQLQLHAPSFLTFTDTSPGASSSSSLSSSSTATPLGKPSNLSAILEAMNATFSKIKYETKTSNKYLGNHSKCDDILSCIFFSVLYNSLESAATFFLGFSEENVHNVVKEYVQG